MNIELLVNRGFIQEEMTKLIFKAVENNITNIIVPSGLLTKFKDLKDTSANFIPIIDYPFGFNSTKIREHDIAQCISHGAKTVDIPINPYLIDNIDFQEIKRDLMTLKKSIGTQNITLRPQLDYRQHDHSLIVDIAKTIADCGFQYIIVNTGLIVDDTIDNLIMCKDISSKTDLEVISLNNHIKEKDYANYTKVKVNALRVSTKNGIENITKFIKKRV